MHILFIVLLVIALGIQIAGMVWAWRWTDTQGGDENVKPLTRLFFTVFWPVTWLVSNFAVQ